MGYVKDIQIGSNTHLIEPILYAVTAGTASAYTLSISNFDLQTGVVVTAKINANNSASATLKVGDSAAKTIRYNNANIAANKLVKDRFYSFIYDGTYWQLIGELDTTYSAGTGLSLSGTTFNHSNSVTASTVGSSSNTSGTTTISIPYFNYDAQGHLTSKGNRTHTISSYPEAYLSWGGKNWSSNYGPIDAAMVEELGANRFMFLKAAGITIEYSRNNGQTWIDYEATDTDKVGLFSKGKVFRIGNNDDNNKATEHGTDYQLQVIINTKNAGVYTSLNKFVIYITTGGSANCTVTIQKALQSTPDDYIDVATDIPISGWSGYNVINVSSFTTYGNTSTSQYGRIKFIFKANGGDTAYNGLSVSKIMAFGGVGWSTPSVMAKTGHLYDYDANQNAIFPKKVTAESFAGDGSEITNISGSNVINAVSAANAVNCIGGNEIILGNNDTTTAIHINHRRIGSGAASGNTAITDYYFKNGNGSINGVTIHATTFDGTATTATNLAAKPSLATSGTTQITVTAGGKTSDAFTVPYATSAGSATQVKITSTSLPSSGNKIYYFTYSESTTTGVQDLKNSARVYVYESTTDTYLAIGSSSNTGALTIRNANGKYVDIKPSAFTANRILTLPDATGTVALTSSDITGNAATATKLATPRTISLTGSVTGSGSFDGSGDLSIATTTNHTHNGIIHRTVLTKGTNPSSDTYFLNSWGFQTGTGTAVADRLGGFLGTVASDGTVSFGIVAYSYSTGNDASTGNWFSVKIKGTTLSYAISAPAAFRNALGASSGVWPVTLGGTGQSTYTIGDILYSGAANSLSKLSGNTTTTRKFLRSVATTSGTAVAPAWDTVTKTDVGLSDVENTKLSTWAGTTNITTVGTISSGTWQGTSVKVSYGGTGATSFTANCVIISGSTTTSALTTRAITNNTSATAVTASTNIITANTLYYHTGNSNITTVGTITSGTWQGTAIGASYGGTGQTSLKNSANTLINALDTGSSNLTANDYVITQYVGGGTTTTTYHRRPASAVINATLVKAALGTDSTTATFLRKDGTWTSTLTANITVKHADGARYIINDGTRDVGFFGQSLDRTKQGIYSYGYNNGSSFSETPRWMIWRDTDGSLNVPSFTNVRSTGDIWPTFTFGLEAQNSTYLTERGVWGRIYYYCPGTQASNTYTYTSNHFSFRQFSMPDSNATTFTPLDNYEQFDLPNVTVGRTTNATYNIITTKGMSAGALYATGSSNSDLTWGTLPIDKGGTGATSVDTAGRNLGISLYINTTNDATSNSAAYGELKTLLETIPKDKTAVFNATINGIKALSKGKLTATDYSGVIARIDTNSWRILAFLSNNLYLWSISALTTNSITISSVYKFTSSTTV